MSLTLALTLLGPWPTSTSTSKPVSKWEIIVRQILLDGFLLNTGLYELTAK